MELLAELLLLLGELVLQLVFEGLAEIGLHSTRDRLRRRKPLSPWVAGTGYVLLGAIAGGISLWAFPHLFIDAPWARIVNLILTPIAAGAVMAAIGAWRRRRHRELIRLDRFAYGFLFALAMAVVRFAGGH